MQIYLENSHRTVQGRNTEGKNNRKIIGGLIMLSAEKLSKLQTANEMLDEKYGKVGTASRAEFDAKAQAWYRRFRR